jgi:hypothetical protein
VVLAGSLVIIRVLVKRLLILLVYQIPSSFN